MNIDLFFNVIATDIIVSSLFKTFYHVQRHDEHLPWSTLGFELSRLCLLIAYSAFSQKKIRSYCEFSRLQLSVCTNGRASRRIPASCTLLADLSSAVSKLTES